MGPLGAGGADGSVLIEVHTHEVAPGIGICEGLGEDPGSGLGYRGTGSGELPDGRQGQEHGRGEGRDGVAGEADEPRLFSAPGEERFSGLHCDAPEVEAKPGFEGGRLDEVVVTHGGAADVVYVGGQWTPDYDIDCSASPPYFPFQKTTTESLGKYYRAGSGAESGSGLYPRRNLSPAVIQGNRNVWFTPLFRTAGAYLVSQRGAKRLLEAVETDTALFMKTPLDMWLLEMDFRGYINASDRFPHPFYQAGFEMVREPSHAQNDIHRCDFQIVKLPARTG